MSEEGSNLVHYGEYSVEAAEEDSRELQTAGDGGFMKLKLGLNVVRFLPPKLGVRSIFQVVWQHYLKVPGEAVPVCFACSRMMAHRKCLACVEASDLFATGNSADIQMAKSINAKRRVFANVINRDSPESGPLVLSFGRQVHEQLIALRRNEEAGGPYADPTDRGFDIVIEREGSTQFDTKYKVYPSRKNSPLSTDLEEANFWIANQQDLARFARVLSEEEQRKLMKGEDGGRKIVDAG